MESWVDRVLVTFMIDAVELMEKLMCSWEMSSQMFDVGSTFSIPFAIASVVFLHSELIITTELGMVSAVSLCKLDWSVDDFGLGRLHSR